MATQDFKLALFAWMPSRGFAPAGPLLLAVYDGQWSGNGSV
jgi:hypothetical protein